jgi:uncharacterized protein YjhX (UPF0386 family)
MRAVMPKPVSADGAKLPVNQDPSPDIPTAGTGADDSKSSSLHFQPAKPFESKDDAEVPSVSMAMSEPHNIDRCTVAVITSLTKKKELNLVSGQPNRLTKKQTISTGKRVFVERKIVKYMVPVNTPGTKSNCTNPTSIDLWNSCWQASKQQAVQSTYRFVGK